MELLQSISLDFGRDTEPITVYEKQGDSKTRFIEIVPINNGQKYALENGITARLHLTKPDGTIVLTDAVIVAETGTIKAELSKQALAVPGLATAEIGLYKGEALLSSQIFYIRVQKKACSDDAVESSNDYKAFTDAFVRVDSAVEEAERAAAMSEAAAQNAVSAAQAAEALLGLTVDEEGYICQTI